MTKEEAEKKGFYIESYGDGFIIADYSEEGNRGRYCGKSMQWTRQPIVPPSFIFETPEEALELLNKYKRI